MQHYTLTSSGSEAERSCSIKLVEDDHIEIKSFNLFSLKSVTKSMVTGVRQFGLGGFKLKDPKASLI